MRSLLFKNHFRLDFTDICLLIGSAVSLANIFFLYAVASHYIDFTDEGFYLNLLSDPFAFEGRITRFAEPIAWLFHAVSEDLVFFRRIFLSLLASGSFLLVFLSLKKTNRLLSIFTASQKYFFLTKVLLALVISNISLFAIWPSLTPSYNYINYLGMLLFAISLLRIDSLKKNQRVISC